jgi:hypothetical protein
MLTPNKVFVVYEDSRYLGVSLSTEELFSTKEEAVAEQVERTEQDKLWPKVAGTVTEYHAVSLDTYLDVVRREGYNEGFSRAREDEST